MPSARPAASSAEMPLPLPERAALFAVHPLNDTPALPADARHVTACAEELGGTEALLPVLRELHARSIGITVVAASKGLAMLEERGPEHNLRLSGPLPDWPQAALHPGALLITPSEDGRLERDFLSRFPLAPTVVVEDFYESGRRSVEYAAEMGAPLPTVCVIDQEAERLVGRRFPGLPVPVEVTGSPFFDSFADEDVAAVQAKSRAELGVPADKKCVAFFLPALGKVSIQLAQEVAGAFRQMDSNDYIFIPRPHPRDSIPPAVYERFFDDVPTLNTRGVGNRPVGNAADLVIAQRSLTVLREVVRQRLTITLPTGLAPGFTFPLVDAGMSAPALPAELSQLIPELLEGKSPRCQELNRNMLALRPDGHAATRVADIVCRAMGLS